MWRALAKEVQAKETCRFQAEAFKRPPPLSPAALGKVAPIPDLWLQAVGARSAWALGHLWETNGSGELPGPVVGLPWARNTRLGYATVTLGLFVTAASFSLT